LRSRHLSFLRIQHEEPKNTGGHDEFQCSRHITVHPRSEREPFADFVSPEIPRFMPRNIGFVQMRPIITGILVICSAPSILG